MQRGLVLTMVAATLAGIGGVVAADVFATVDPAVVAQYRSVIAAVVLVPIAYRRRMTMTAGRLPQLALFGAVIAALTITFYWSIDRFVDINLSLLSMSDPPADPLPQSNLESQ